MMMVVVMIVTNWRNNSLIPTYIHTYIHTYLYTQLSYVKTAVVSSTSAPSWANTLDQR